MAEHLADSLRVHLEIPPEVSLGEAVPITLRLENLTDRALELYLTGRTIAFDLTVTAPDGEVAWRRLHAQVIPSILRFETLAPRDSLLLQDTWEQRSNAGESVSTGSYTVLGEVFTEGPPLVSPAVRLQIVPD